MKIDHISFIISTELSLQFFETLGFSEISRLVRSNDTIVWLEGYESTLEIYIDPRHPEHITGPEALGIRHLGISVDNIDSLCQSMTEKGYMPEPIRVDERTGARYTFVKDPDGQPWEIRE